MAKPWKKTAAAAKTKTLSKAPAKRQIPTKTQAVQSTHKRKPEDSASDSEESPDSEPPCKWCKKHVKQVADNEPDVVDDRLEVEPELVSDGNRNDTRLSDEEVQNWGYSMT